MQMLDDVLTGVSRGDFAVTLERAAAFARIVAAGRAELSADLADVPDDEGERRYAEHDLVRSAGRLLRTAEQLESGARRWRSGQML